MKYYSSEEISIFLQFPELFVSLSINRTDSLFSCSLFLALIIHNTRKLVTCWVIVSGILPYLTFVYPHTLSLNVAEPPSHLCLPPPILPNLGYTPVELSDPHATSAADVHTPHTSP